MGDHWDSNRWDRIGELLEAARDLPSEEISGFLDRATDDEGIKREVSELLFARLRSGDLLEHAPPVEWIQQGTEETAPPRLAEGEKLAGRFEVVGFLGRGGMGEVYEAYDSELGESVAVKVLHPDLANDSRFLEWFRREIRLARKVSHPNVARVYDLVVDEKGPHAPLSLYVMELVRGETLADRLKRDGPLRGDSALSIAKQLANGLQAAHQAGVIHRDFKPANVILNGERPVITDFGLASAIRVEGDESPRTTSLLLGTPGYVAPEQWAGKRASVATDVYSFGVVLHEIVTGMHPNEAGGGELSAPWQKAVEGCLAIDPKDRWRRISDVEAALSSPGPIRRRAMLIGILGGGVSLSVLGLRLWKTTRQFAPGTRLMILAAENHTRDEALNSWTAVLARQIDLSNQTAPIVAGPNPGTAPTAEKSRADAQAAACPLLLFTSISTLGGELSLQLRLEAVGDDPRYPAKTWKRDWQGRDRNELLRYAADAGSWIRSTVGEAEDQLQSRAQHPEGLMSASWDALRVFRLGEAAAASGDTQQALTLFQEAFAIDPKFGIAAARCADLLAQLHRVDEASRFQDLAHQLLTESGALTREALRSRMDIAVDSWRFGEGARAADLYRSRFPDDNVGYCYAADFHRFGGRAEEALALYRRAAELGPHWNRVSDKIGIVLLTLGRFQEASEHLDRWRAPRSDGWRLRLQGVLVWASGRATEARKSFEAMRAMTSPADADASYWGQLHLAAYHAWQGSRREANSSLEELLAWSRARNRTGDLPYVHYHLAESLLQEGDHGRAAAHAIDAYKVLPGAHTWYASAGYLLRAGQRENALMAAEPHLERISNPRLAAARLQYEGEVALQSGRFVEAIAKFEAARRDAWEEQFPGGLVRAMRGARETRRAETLLAGVRTRAGAYLAGVLENQALFHGRIL